MSLSERNKLVCSTAMPISEASTLQKQNKILEVAGELFLERGFDNVSLNDILERTGGSKKTIYSYYGGKDGLLAALVHSICETKLKPLLTVDISHLEPREGLRAWGTRFLAIVSMPEGEAFIRMLIGVAERFPEVAEEFYSSFPGAVVEAIKTNIERWQSQKLVCRGNAEAMAIQFIGIIVGNFTLRSLLSLSPPFAENELEGWVESGVTRFLDGATPR